MSGQKYIKIADNNNFDQLAKDYNTPLSSTIKESNIEGHNLKIRKKDINIDNNPNVGIVDTDIYGKEENIFERNPDFSLFKFYFYMFIHCLSGFYYGFQLSCLTCLGKPIIHSSFTIFDSKEVDHWLGTFNLSFGIGKMCGSLVAGSFAKAIGKVHVLYLAEIFNVISCVLMYFGNPYWFLAGWAVCGFCCGFNSTCAPRLILENYPTKYWGVPPAMYGLFLTLGVCWSYSIGKIFGDDLMNKYWYILMIAPGIILLTRNLVVFLFFNHESPIYYTVKAKETNDLNKIEKYRKIEDKLLRTYYIDANEIIREKKKLLAMTEELITKSTEKSLYQ